jgi:hypothetical protein
MSVCRNNPKYIIILVGTNVYKVPTFILVYIQKFASLIYYFVCKFPLL